MDPKSKVPRILNWILLLVCVTIPIQAMESRKLDEEKCAPCGETPSSPPPVVYNSPPPPPVVYPSPPPPPPTVYYSPPPPPSPKKPSPAYCPPPPSSSSYQYITGPPGNLYPVDENFSGATTNRRQSFAALLPLFVGFLILQAFW